MLLDARGRAARGVEDAQQPQRSRTEVLHAVDLAAGQEDARAAADGGPAPPGPHPPTPFEDAQHLFVVMEVVGRAPGRDRAHELRDGVTADGAVHQDLVGAIAGRL